MLLHVMSVKDSLNVELLSCRATTNLDLFLRPSRKVTTKLLTSPVLLEVKEYSSCLMVASVKVPPLKGQPFETSDQKAQAAALGHRHKNGELGPSHSSSLAPPAARNRSDFWEGEFQQHLLLFIHKINSSPVDSNNQVILQQTGTWQAEE